jgi:hypothetical protein
MPGLRMIWARKLTWHALLGANAAGGSRRVHVEDAAGFRRAYTAMVSAIL